MPAPCFWAGHVSWSSVISMPRGVTPDASWRALRCANAPGMVGGEARRTMTLGAQPHNEACIIQPLPSGLTAAFTLKDVRQVKDGMTVLDGVELDIPHGAITALVGPSGAGKTSLLRLLNRLDDPVSGDIVYRARAITHYPVQELRRKVGFVFQTPVMFPGTVRDNLQVALTLGGRALRPCADTVAPAAGQDAERRVAAAMALAELDGTLCDRDG